MATGVIVPQGWLREVEGESVHYISPDMRKLTTPQELLFHLTSPGTCKCGLRCPFKFEEQFSFDPSVLSLPDHSSLAQGEGNFLCKVAHRKQIDSRKMVARLPSKFAVVVAPKPLKPKRSSVAEKSTSSPASDVESSRSSEESVHIKKEENSVGKTLVANLAKLLKSKGMKVTEPATSRGDSPDDSDQSESLSPFTAQAKRTLADFLASPSNSDLQCLTWLASMSASKIFEQQQGSSRDSKGSAKEPQEGQKSASKFDSLSDSNASDSQAGKFKVPIVLGGTQAVEAPEKTSDKSSKSVVTSAAKMHLECKRESETTVGGRPDSMPQRGESDSNNLEPECSDPTQIVAFILSKMLRGDRDSSEDTLTGNESHSGGTEDQDTSMESQESNNGKSDHHQPQSNEVESRPTGAPGSEAMEDTGLHRDEGESRKPAMEERANTEITSSQMQHEDDATTGAGARGNSPPSEAMTNECDGSEDLSQQETSTNPAPLSERHSEHTPGVTSPTIVTMFSAPGPAALFGDRTFRQPRSTFHHRTNSTPQSTSESGVLDNRQSNVPSQDRDIGTPDQIQVESLSSISDHSHIEETSNESACLFEPPLSNDPLPSKSGSESAKHRKSSFTDHAPDTGMPSSLIASLLSQHQTPHSNISAQNAQEQEPNKAQASTANLTKLEADTTPTKRSPLKDYAMRDFRIEIRPVRERTPTKRRVSTEFEGEKLGGGENENGGFGPTLKKAKRESVVRSDVDLFSVVKTGTGVTYTSAENSGVTVAKRKLQLTAAASIVCAGSATAGLEPASSSVPFQTSVIALSDSESTQFTFQVPGARMESGMGLEYRPLDASVHDVLVQDLEKSEQELHDQQECLEAQVSKLAACVPLDITVTDLVAMFQDPVPNGNVPVPPIAEATNLTLSGPQGEAPKEQASEYLPNLPTRVPILSMEESPEREEKVESSLSAAVEKPQVVMEEKEWALTECEPDKAETSCFTKAKTETEVCQPTVDGESLLGAEKEAEVTPTVRDEEESLTSEVIVHLPTGCGDLCDPSACKEESQVPVQESQLFETAETEAESEISRRTPVETTDSALLQHTLLAKTSGNDSHTTSVSENTEVDSASRVADSGDKDGEGEMGLSDKDGEGEMGLSDKNGEEMGLLAEGEWIRGVEELGGVVSSSANAEEEDTVSSGNNVERGEIKDRTENVGRDLLEDDSLQGYVEDKCNRGEDSGSLQGYVEEELDRGDNNASSRHVDNKGGDSSSSQGYAEVEYNNQGGKEEANQDEKEEAKRGESIASEEGTATEMQEEENDSRGPPEPKSTPLDSQSHDAAVVDSVTPLDSQSHHNAAVGDSVTPLDSQFHDAAVGDSVAPLDSQSHDAAVVDSVTPLDSQSHHDAPVVDSVTPLDSQSHNAAVGDSMTPLDSQSHDAAVVDSVTAESAEMECAYAKLDGQSPEAGADETGVVASTGDRSSHTGASTTSWEERKTDVDPANQEPSTLSEDTVTFPVSDTGSGTQSEHVGGEGLKPAAPTKDTQTPKQTNTASVGVSVTSPSKSPIKVPISGKTMPSDSSPPLSKPSSPRPRSHRKRQSSSCSSSSSSPPLKRLKVSVPLKSVDIVHQRLIECYEPVFGVGDIIWAKAPQLPGWPGKIISVKDWKKDKLKPAPKGKVWVEWFGDCTVSLVDEDQVKRLKDGIEQRIKHKKSLNKPLRDAIRAAQKAQRKELKKNSI